jgi:hypothetical protein
MRICASLRRFEEIVEEKETPKDTGKRPAEGKPDGGASSQKKQKKDGDKKPAPAPANDAKAQPKSTTNADAKPPGAQGAPGGHGKKHKKNKVRNIMSVLIIQNVHRSSPSRTRIKRYKSPPTPTL